MFPTTFHLQDLCAAGELSNHRGFDIFDGLFLLIELFEIRREERGSGQVQGEYTIMYIIPPRWMYLFERICLAILPEASANNVDTESQ